jgi:hypothetical protein
MGNLHLNSSLSVKLPLDRHGGGFSLKSVANSQLTPQELTQVGAYWRAANYLRVAMIYLKRNPLLGGPLISTPRGIV